MNTMGGVVSKHPSETCIIHSEGGGSIQVRVLRQRNVEHGITVACEELVERHRGLLLESLERARLASSLLHVLLDHDHLDKTSHACGTYVGKRACCM